MYLSFVIFGLNLPELTHEARVCPLLDERRINFYSVVGSENRDL